MKRTTLLSSLAASLLGGVASLVHASMLECPPGPCTVDITVDAATCTISVFPDHLMVHKPSAMHFRLRTPGWRFGPEKDIHFKDAPAGGRLLPADLFTRVMSQSNLRVTVIHNRYDIEKNPLAEERGEFPYSITVVKDDGSKSCTVDPVVVNN